MQFLKKIIKETIPVVLGVLLALLLNNWKESYDSDRYTEEFYGHILEEVKHNSRQIEKVIGSHKSLCDSLDYYKDKDVSGADVVLVGGGLQMPVLQNTSWKLLQSSQLGQLDFEVMSLLAGAERVEYYLGLDMENLMEALIEYDYSTEALGKQRIKDQVEQLIDKEETLLSIFEMYEEWHENYQ